MYSENDKGPQDDYHSFQKDEIVFNNTPTNKVGVQYCKGCSRHTIETPTTTLAVLLRRALFLPNVCEPLTNHTH